MPALPIVLAILGASAAQGAYSASQSRKAQKKAREEANTRELIEGSAPNLSNVAEVIAEDVQGTDVAGLEEALAAMDYGGGEVPIPSGEPLPMEDPTEDLSEAELMALIEQSGIAQMASGGPVGTPEDVYYFNVPQVMGMMQDPNPQIQGVGMQLADIMSSTPGMDMVPATRDQITMMAYGGAVTAKKYADGDQVKGTDQSLREIKGLLKNKGISEIEKLLGFRLPENFDQRDTKDILFDELMDRFDLPVDIQKEDDEYSMSKLFGDEDASLRLGASTNRGDPQIRLDFQKRFANGGSIEYNDGGATFRDPLMEERGYEFDPERNAYFEDVMIEGYDEPIRSYFSPRDQSPVPVLSDARQTEGDFEIDISNIANSLRDLERREYALGQQYPKLYDLARDGLAFDVAEGRIREEDLTSEDLESEANKFYKQLTGQGGVSIVPTALSKVYSDLKSNISRDERQNRLDNLRDILE